MTDRAFSSLLCAVAATASLAAGPAVAQVDLSGQWRLASILYPVPVCAEFVQSAAALDAMLPPPQGLTTPFDLTGTVDPSSGGFSLSGPVESCRCGSCGCTFRGDASSDGLSFDATLTCTSAVTIVVNGHRYPTCLTLPFSVDGDRGACDESPLCPGDCDGDSAVTADELVSAVNIMLDPRLLDTCPMADADADGAVTVGELVQAVSAALIGCN